MRATEVVKVTGGEPPVEGGRGGVVAPLEGDQTGLDCARGQRLARELAAPGAPVVIVVRLVSATRRPTVLYAHHDRDSAASMVIVVRLVSATRRPTEHRAHHDRDGRPATKGP
jgi:hypothetical protein